MGHSSIARCPCGFESEELYCGGGFSNFATVCDAPLICNDCGYIGTINVMEKGELAPWVLRMWDTTVGSGSGLKAEDSVHCPSCGSANIVVTVGLTEPTEPTRQVAESYLGDGFIFFLPGPYKCPNCGEAKLILRKHSLWD